MHLSRQSKIIIIVAVAFTAGFLISQNFETHGGRTDQVRLLQQQNESLRSEIERLKSN